MTFLSRLEGLRDHGHGQFVAKCPSHVDRSPSLSVKVEPDGTVLLHCFAGCTPLEVVNSVGMTLADLFPEPFEAASRKPVWNYRALLETLGHEALVVIGAATQILDGYTLSLEELEEIKQARLKVAGVLEVINARRR